MFAGWSFDWFCDLWVYRIVASSCLVDLLLYCIELILVGCNIGNCGFLWFVVCGFCGLLIRLFGF